ncbi:MAG: hypothetical protein ABWK53_12780 [Anaerolineales bacterium]
MNGGLLEIALIAAGILLFLALVGLMVFAILRQQRVELERARARRAELLRRAEQAAPARARIVRAQPAAGQGMAATLSVTLQLEVTPPGGAPYPASAVWLVEKPLLGGLQPGNEISVRIDRQDAQIVYPDMGGARYVGKF